MLPQRIKEILIRQIVGNKAKGRISKRVFQESKVCQNLRKTNISYPLIRTFILIDEKDIASYADNNSPYTVGHTPHIMNKPERAFKIRKPEKFTFFSRL